MQQPEASSGKECASARGAWPVAAAAAAIAMALAMALIPMFFPTNDDPYAQQIMAGLIAPEPSGYISFMNYCLCWLVSRLYALISGVAWWPLVQLALIYVSMTMIGYAAFCVTCQRLPRLPRWAAFACLTCAEVGLFSLLVARLQFTDTASLLMTAAIVCSCCAPGRGGHPVARAVLPAVLGAIGFAIREQSGLLGLAFWGCAVVAALVRVSGGVRERLATTRRYWSALAMCVVMCLGLFVVQRVVYGTAEWQAAFDGSISPYTDYPRVSYESDPERYESVGWDEDLAELVADWYAMDERITPEALDAVMANNNTWLTELLQDPGEVTASRLSEASQRSTVSYFALFAGAFVAVVSLTRCGTRRVALLTGVLALGLLGYLFLRGRIPQRAVFSVVLPALGALASVGVGERRPGPRDKAAWPTIVSLVLCAGFSAPLFVSAARAGRFVIAVSLMTMALAAARDLAVRRGTNGRVLRVLSGGILALLAALTLLPAACAVTQYGYGSEDYAKEAQRERNVDAFYDYAEAHPNTLFIFDGSASLVSQDPWNLRCPNNQVAWGGWRYLAPWYDEALKKAGFSGRQTTEDFFDENVRFVSGSEKSTDLLRSYLEGLYGPVTFVSERVLGTNSNNGRDTIVVYRIERVG
ncbi:hypothetical protein H6A07_05020 [Olsenella uli]|uniref:hypothetical protein n=1 Tax=Olsenella uli TaxID=133926 RepID=UPI00195CDF68|nr:hypothetical protein [Olsenella uli]MBM6676100.1 hypothetical protein [Olsenella uli]